MILSTGIHTNVIHMYANVHIRTTVHLGKYRGLRIADGIVHLFRKFCGDLRRAHAHVQIEQQNSRVLIFVLLNGVRNQRKYKPFRNFPTVWYFAELKLILLKYYT